MPRVGREPQTELGHFLRGFRKQHRFSMRELADRAGISHSYLNALEIGVDHRTGKAIHPGPEVLRRLANVLTDEGYPESHARLMRAAGYIAESTEPIEELLAIWRHLPSEGQDRVLNFARFEATEVEKNNRRLP